jgi:hypothetical protein
MRISDVIAGLALVFTIIASLYFHHRSKKLGANQKRSSTQVEIQTMADKKGKRAAEPGKEPAPTYLEHIPLESIRFERQEYALGSRNPLSGSGAGAAGSNGSWPMRLRSSLGAALARVGPCPASASGCGGKHLG